MNKLFTKIVGAALGLTMAIGVGVAVASSREDAVPVHAGVGATYTINSANLTGWGTTQVAQTGTSGVFTLEATKTGSNGGGANTSSQIRIYSGATFTLSCSSGNMTQAVFTCTAQGNSSNGPQKLSGTGYSGGSGYTGTWTGDASSFSLSAGAQCRVTQIVVTYDDGQSGQKLSAPVPAYDSANNRITWSSVSNASSYDLTVDGGSVVHNATSPYTLGSLANSSAHTVTVTAIGNGTTYLDSDAGSITFALLSHAGSQADPYTVSDARAAIDDTTGTLTLTGKYVSGIVSKLYGNTPSVTSDGEISYFISDDGSTSNEIEAFKGKSFSGASFTSIDEIQVGDVVTVSGDLLKYNSTYELAQGNVLVSLVRPTAPTLESISISGSMTKTSYTTAESWDPSGLTVTAYYDNSSDDDVTSSVIWSYSVATPAAMGAGTDTLTITATYEGESDSTTASVTVVVPSYTNTYNLGGNYHIYVANASDNTDGAWINDGSTKNAKGAPYGVSSENDAGVYTLTLVGNDTFTITLGTDYLYSIADNNGIRLASNPSNGTENWVVTKDGDYYHFNNQVQTTRYLSYYSSGNDIRSYTNTNTANVTLSVPKVVSGFSVYSTGANKNVLKGSTFNAAAAAEAGFQARLNYTDSTYDDVTNDATWTLDTSTVGTATLTVTYLSYDPVTFTDMNIYTAVITSLTIDASSAKTTYLEGETLVLTGLVITGHDSSSNNYTLEIEDCTFSPASGATLSTSNTSVTVTYTNENSSTAQASYSITVNAFVGYTKVTSAEGLVVGDSYVIGVENTNKCYELMGAASAATTTAYRNRVDGTSAFNDAKTSVTQSGASTAGAVVLTLLSDGNGKYAFYDITNDAYLTGKTSTSSSNHLYDSDALSDDAWWTISFADGLMSVVLNGTDNRVLGYNLGSPRFSTYTNYAANSTTVSSGTAHPVLFRMAGSSVKTSVTSFANNSLKMNDSAYEGDITTANCASNYSAMKTAYAALSEAEKNVFQYSSDYSAARERLLKWAKANGETFTYGNETPFASARILAYIGSSDASSLTTIIVIVSLVSLTAIGGYFFLRKRKEQ